MVARLDKLNFANQKSVSYAEIYVNDSTAAQAIPDSTNYTKITLWESNGLSKRCIAASSSDKITITKNGIYMVNGSFSIESGTVNVVVRCAAFLGGVEQDNIHYKRKIATANDAGSASFSGLISVTSAPQDIDVRMRHDTGAPVNIIFDYASLNIISVD